MRMRSGRNCSITWCRALPKSPTREQQIQPEFISEISMPASFMKPPSMPISPNSFSISTIFSPLRASVRSFLMRVVLPAPKKPEIMSIFVMWIASFQKFSLYTTPFLENYKGEAGDFFTK